jgi:hypothetical protein
VKTIGEVRLAAFKLSLQMFVEGFNTDIAIGLFVAIMLVAWIVRTM